MKSLSKTAEAANLIEISNGRIAFTHLALMLLYKCNFRCKDCLIGEHLDDPVKLTVEDACRIIEQLSELRTIHVIGFVGGEPFIAYKTMIKVAEYIHAHYKCYLSATTNSSWATSKEKAVSMLRPLAEFGMKWLLLSWDDFHAEFTSINRLAFATQAAQELGIEVTIQNIMTPESTTNEEFKSQLIDLGVDIENIRWAENNVVPTGLAEGITYETIDYEALEKGGCSAGKILTVRPDGSLRPCCGAALMNENLSLGNLNKENVVSLLDKASWNPMINSLIANAGPSQLIRILEQQINHQELVPRGYGHPCDACNQVLNNQKSLEILKHYFKGREPQLALARINSEMTELSAPME